MEVSMQQFKKVGLSVPAALWQATKDLSARTGVPASRLVAAGLRYQVDKQMPLGFPQDAPKQVKAK
jgi:hypothetical protein